MDSHKRSFKMLLATGVMSLFLAACGGGGGGQTPTPSTASPSPSPAASPTPVASPVASPTPAASATPAVSQTPTVSETPTTGGQTSGGQAYKLGPALMGGGAENPDADPNATLTIDYAKGAQTFDPQVESFVNEIQVSSQVFAPLLALDKDNNLVANAAESMTVSPDGKTYTFKIRSGMTYSDGKPVTAENYAYAIKRACDPNVNGKYSSILYAIQGCQAWREADLEKDKAKLPQLKAVVDKAVTATDDQTLVIKLTQPAGYFPYVMATWVTYPSRQDLVEAGGTNWWKDPKYFIGNGPFKMVSYNPQQGVVFERNDNYFRGKPGVAKLVFKVINDPQVGFLAYQRGELDAVGISSDQLPQIKGDLQKQLVRQIDAATFYIGFNLEKKPFDNQKVRQAIAYALNREQYIRQINGGVGKPAGTFIPPGIPGHQDEVQQTYDPEKARQLLAEAGYPNGRGFPPQKLYYDAEDSAAKKRAIFIQQNLKQVLNIDIVATPLESTTLQSMLNDRSKNPPIYRLGWIQDYPHPQDWDSLVFGNNSPLAPNGWNDPEFNALVNKADKLPIDQAIPLYQQAEKILVEKAPVAFQFHSESLVLIKPNVKGVSHHLSDPLGLIYESDKIYKTK